MADLDAALEIEDELKILITQKYINMNKRTRWLVKEIGWQWNKGKIVDFEKDLCELIRIASFNQKFRDATRPFLKSYQHYIITERSFEKRAVCALDAWNDLSDLLRDYALITIKSKE